MNIDLLANIVGMIGMGMVVCAYIFLQLEKLDPKGLSYNLINLVGALLLLLSLTIHVNLASIVIELFWIAASIFGVVQYYRRRSNKTKTD